MNWSKITKFPLFISSRREPTAVVEIMYLHPSAFNAKTFALLFIFVGGISCFIPWREIITTSIFFILPVIKGEEGFPKGVSTSFVLKFSRISGFSSPEPPIIPIFISIKL